MILALACGGSIVLALVIRRRDLASVTMLTLVLYGVFGVVGSVVALSGNDWWLRDVSRENLQLAYHVYNSIGVVFAVVAVSVRPASVSPTLDLRGLGWVTNFFCGLVVVGCLGVSLGVLFAGSPLHALLVERNADALVLAELRGALGIAAAESRPIIYFRNLAIGYLLPFSVALIGVRAHITGRGRGLFVLACGVYVFCSAIDLSKAPIVFALALPVLLRAHLGILSRRVALLAGAALCAAVATLYSLVMGAAGAEVATQALHRITVAQYAGLPLTFEVFPGVTPHIGVTGGVGLLRTFSGNQSEFYSRSVMQFANPAGVESGTAGFMSTVSYAEGYAMSGMPGLFIGAAVAIVFILALDRIRGSRSALASAVYVVLLLKVPRLFFDSLSALVWNYGILLLLVTVCGLMFIEEYVLPVRDDNTIGSSERELAS